MLLALLIGCASHAYRFPGPLAGLGREPLEEAPTASEGKAPRTHGDGDAVAAAAEGFLGDRKLSVRGEAYRFDCSGLVEASLAKAGCAFTGSSADLFEKARAAGVLHRRRVPEVGDVAFFDDTYDRNGNGRLDDPLSHVAVVESVDADGTVHMVHVGSKGVVRLVMNLRDPSTRADEAGKTLNDYLRAQSKRDPARTRYLAGELWVGFGSFWKGDRRVASI